MASERDPEPAPGPGPSRWLPTHVQVTVLQARGLRGKSSGAGSTSDAYTVIQVGREKYSTSVVEKTRGCPEWREECSFELPPGALDGLLRAQEAEAGAAPWAAAGAAAACELVLTTMHRSLIGVDKFLGQATVALDEVFGGGRTQHTQWYKLHSKAGKKEKERGEIQVTIQFTRNNLSASMFDLSMKDKPRSPFSKIKDKMKGRKKFELESASAILPSSALEDPELGSLGKMGKAKGFFLRNKLRKSSLTQSNTSLGSDSTLSSASGSLAFQGPGAELLTRSPSRSSWLSSEGGRDSTQSPKLLTHKRTYSDEASQARGAPIRALLEMQGHLDMASRSSLCVNGSHIYNEEPQGLLRHHRSSISGPFPTSSSLHGGSISARPSEEVPLQADEPQARGSRSVSSSETGQGPEEPSGQTKASTGHSGEEAGVRFPEGKPVQVATPIVAEKEAEKEGARKEERKPRIGLFHPHHQGLGRSESGRRSSLGDRGGTASGASPHHTSSGEEKAKSSWFGLREVKEPTQKPRALRANPAPLDSPGKAPPEWDDTDTFDFDVFASGRLSAEAGHQEGLGLEGAGLAATGLHHPGPTEDAAEPQGEPVGRGSSGSSVWLESQVPLDLGLDSQASGRADEGAPGLSADLPSSTTSRPQQPSEATPAQEAGQSPAESATSLFSSPEMISVWERLSGPDDTPEGSDQDASLHTSQLFPELNAATDAWPWDVVSISPATEPPSLALLQEPKQQSPGPSQPESPEPVTSKGSEGLPPPEELESEPQLEWGPDKGVHPTTPPPKPPRLFTAFECKDNKESGELYSHGTEPAGEDVSPTVRCAGPQDEGDKTQPAEPGLEEPEGDAGPRVSGSCRSLPKVSPEGPVPLSSPGQQIRGTPKGGEGPEGPQAESLGPAGKGRGLQPGSSQQADRWALKEDAFNPFFSRVSQDPPSFPSISPPGSRESSFHSDPEELPMPPEPAFSPPPLPPWASHRHGGSSPPCSPLPGAWPLTSFSSSPPPGEPATPTGGSPSPHGEHHATAIPASPLVLLPLETRPAEEFQPAASPHPVKPLSAASVEGSPDRKPSRSSLSTALSSGLERLRTVTSGSIQPVAPAPQVASAVDAKRLKDSGLLDQSAKYYHLTHDELIGLLLQRERELSQRDEHVQELESYIDRLLVRIMETSPTLLQIPPEPPK
ncbi:rab11 family-interacting protein 5 isoform X2 [Suncus etruscus]|uniref:rab11 family-interacting protein 5 isoform X2 n=1 Tax=Suncus etruscus TaxID=109475 RepID=UPI002110C78D|nr:rab11 family-interacting protein 5 isoform X2 [Suncus etruscus]